MRALGWLALLAIVSPISGFGQTQQKTTTFTNSNGEFRFVYPSDSKVCMRGKIDACNQSFIPVCGEDALVCVIHPDAELRDTNFGAASFEVREISIQQEMMTADVCVTPYPGKDGDTVSSWPEFLISAEHPVEIIGGVEFVHGVKGGVATGHWSSIDLYRTFRKQRCFELSINETGTDPSITDPPLKTLNPTQRRKLDHRMSEILHSFQFIN